MHQRVRSRSELAQSMEGEGSRTDVFATVIGRSRTSRPARRHAAARAPLDPAGGLPLSTEGVYPVELIAQDAAGARR